ncbi:hypothetical protein [Candidatus Nitrosotenuis chungbukensis]|uniref:hypothetical protein n=1 Tax=Candidatus Nitrosotenuis chungbukensis TaxID=1353246 RepID=UPI000694BC6F|nr:hypothetical protein [Candidatus Nitrosotenuis chungbukensis]
MTHIKLISIATVLLLLCVTFSSTAFAETRVPYWIIQNLRWWANDKIPTAQIESSLLWIGVREKIKMTLVDGPSQIPDVIKRDTKKWNLGELSDAEFFNKIKSGLKDGSIKISSKSKFNINDYKEHEFSGHSPLFRTFAYKKDFITVNGEKTPRDIQFELRSNQTEMYKRLMVNEKDAIVIVPIFTKSAYDEPGFYTYYRGECDTKCLTKQIKYTAPHGYSSSSNAIKVLNLLGYHTNTDVAVDSNPKILSKYKKVIVLHNEYVTQAEFDAITSHPRVLYLYPNALYAKVSANYQTDTITLVRGHHYPTSTVGNGFDWKFDNSKLEYDTTCKNWSFTKVKNGKMLNCYPEHIIFSDAELLKAIKDY